MDKVELKSATRDDVDVFFDGKMRNTCRAWSVFVNDELVAICGVFFTRYTIIAFSSIKPDYDYNKMTCWRMAVKIWTKIKSLGYSTVYAVSSDSLDTAPAFLERLGFKHAHGDIYVWEKKYG